MTLKIDKQHCDSASCMLGERKDCSVYACSIATQIPYLEMHAYLAEHGRERRTGMFRRQYLGALAELGYDLQELRGPSLSWTEHFVEGHHVWNRKKGEWVWRSGHYRDALVVTDTEDAEYTARTPKKLERELDPDKVYLAMTATHVFCIRDGIVQDWIKGRRHRLEAVYEVTEGTGQILPKRKPPTPSFKVDENGFWSKK
jgi:hypothetical protein